MTAIEFFNSQLLTDASSVIDKTRHKYSRNDLIKFAEAYYKAKREETTIHIESNMIVRCGTCKTICQQVRTGKWQCPICE